MALQVNGPFTGLKAVVFTLLFAGLAACGGNPFIDPATTGGGATGGGATGGGGTGGGTTTPVDTASLGTLQSFSYTPGAATMAITLTAQDAAALTATCICCGSSAAVRSSLSIWGQFFGAQLGPACGSSMSKLCLSRFI